MSKYDPHDNRFNAKPEKMFKLIDRRLSNAQFEKRISLRKKFYFQVTKPYATTLNTSLTMTM